MCPRKVTCVVHEIIRLCINVVITEVNVLRDRTSCHSITPSCNVTTAKLNKYMSSVRKRVEISLGDGVLLSLHLKSVQVNNIHAIIFVHRLGSRAILSALVYAAL